MAKQPTDRQLREYLGSLELRIMHVVWSNGEATVNDVLDRLNKSKGRNLVYNTVMSTMARLHDKGYLDRHRQGRAYVYTSDGPAKFLQARLAETFRAAFDEHGELAAAGFKDQLTHETRAMLQGINLDEG